MRTVPKFSMGAPARFEIDKALAAAGALEDLETIQSMTAQGTFDVNVIPQPADGPAAGPFGRLLLDKKFHGALEGESKGQMLGTQNEADNSGGYVALELVTGTLDGKRGSFILQHNGTMSQGVATMNVNVVPGSGTGELKGISGRMTIIIEGKEHRYDFEYALGS